MPAALLSCILAFSSLMWFRSAFILLSFLAGITASAQTVATDSVHVDSIKTFTRTGMMGSAFTVPEGKVWNVKSVFCNTGSYNIKVTSVKYKDEYLPGEKVTLPSWCAEAELLDGGNSSSMMYSVKIEERRK